MVTNVMTGMVQGVEGFLIRVEADLSQGLPMLNLVGSLAPEVKEGKERVRTALKNTGIHLPASRITVNLAPGDMRKTGTSFDLAIAAALFMALKLVPSHSCEGVLLLGELSLDGSLLPVQGVLPILQAARKEGYRECIVPFDNLEEASLLEGMQAQGFENLQELYDFLRMQKGENVKNWYCLVEEESEETKKTQKAQEAHAAIRVNDCSSQADTGNACFPGSVKRRLGGAENSLYEDTTDFAEVRGQKLAKRALEIAVAGFHNVLLDGPPGVGKSMVASCVPGIMPEMTMEEKIETTMIYSVKGLLGNQFYLVEKRPFRAPSHNITMAGMFGGGMNPVPGEISLAHHGVLFLDEFPEYRRDMMEMFRIPLEEHKMMLVRNNRSIVFPADFILIAAANPCPCGYYPDRNRCRCSNRDIRNYHNRISGPMRDRIDLFVRCEEVGYDTLTSGAAEETSSVIRVRVMRAWDRQRQRWNRKVQISSEGFKEAATPADFTELTAQADFQKVRKEADPPLFSRVGYRFNGRLSSQDVRDFCSLTEEGNRMLQASYRQLGLSGRGYYRILKVARTIADLAGEDNIASPHLEEALLYRNIMNL